MALAAPATQMGHHERIDASRTEKTVLKKRQQFFFFFKKKGVSDCRTSLQRFTDRNTNVGPLSGYILF